MKKLFIGICEHSSEDLKYLIQHLEVGQNSLDTNFEIFTYTTGSDFLTCYRPIFDIIFLSIPFCDMDTECFVSQLRKKDPFVRIIFISHSHELYPIGFKYTAKNYFVKPLRQSNILNELKNSISEPYLLKAPHIWVSTRNIDYKLYLRHLRYVETFNRQLIFHYGNDEYNICGKISDLENNLSNSNFFRCNNSYLVNINYIEKIKPDANRYLIDLITGESIPLSRHKKRELLKLISSLSN